MAWQLTVSLEFFCMPSLSRLRPRPREIRPLALELIVDMVQFPRRICVATAAAAGYLSRYPPRLCTATEEIQQAHAVVARARRDWCAELAPVVGRRLRQMTVRNFPCSFSEHALVCCGYIHVKDVREFKFVSLQEHIYAN